MFTGTNGKFWIYDSYCQLYERLLKKQGIDYTKNNLYSFRHTFCTELLQSGADVKTVQAAMGDSSSQMVMDVYCHLNKEGLSAANRLMANRMSEIMANRQTG